MNSPFDKLGKLLVELGWIGFTELQAALSHARSLAVPLGLVLLERGLLSRNELNASLEAQSSVRDRLLDPIHAIMALTIVGWSSVSFGTALKFLGLESHKSVHASKLGQILIDSDCISLVERNAGLSAAGTIGLQLGQMLLLQQSISASCLKMALEVQDLIRRNVMAWDDAIHCLKQTYSKCDATANDQVVVPILPDLRLGELLVLSEVVSRDDIKMSLESAQTNNRPLGEILSIFALVPTSTLAAALEIQRMLRRGELTIDESVSALSCVFHHGVSVSQAVRISRRHRSGASRKLSLALFLKTVGVFNENDVESIVHSCLDSSKVIDRFGNFDKPVEPFALNSGARLNYLIKAGVLTLDAACFAFHYCVEHNVDVDSFLKEAGWFMPVEPGSEIFVAHNGTFALV